MSPPRSANPQRPLVRQLSLQQIQPPPVPAPASSGRRGLLRRQRSAEDDRPVTRLLHSALRVTASALGPGFIADNTPPPPPAPKANRLRPVRVAWAELRKSTPDASEAVAVIAQKVGVNKPHTSNARPPTCLPALARANLDIFLAHSGLAQCITSNLTSDLQTSTSTNVPLPTTPSPREPLKLTLPLSPLPSRRNLQPPVSPSPASQLTASVRRVNFRNSAFRPINRSLSDSSEPKPPLADTRALRVLSAPAHRPSPVIVPPRPILRSLPRRGPLQSSFDSGDQQPTLSAGERIRSAPPRRRLKVGGSSAARRNKNRRGEESSGDEEVEEISTCPVPIQQPPPVPRTCSSANSSRSVGRRGLRVGAEIVTMVSLVSPTVSSDSEQEDEKPAVITTPPVAVPTTNNEIQHLSSLSSVIVCARKITKSVSFQAHRGSLSRRRSSTQLALAAAAASLTASLIPSAVIPHDEQEKLPVEKTEEQKENKQEIQQEKQEIKSIKKKLVRTKPTLLKQDSVDRCEKVLSSPKRSDDLEDPLSPAGTGGGNKHVVVEGTLSRPLPTPPVIPTPLITEEDGGPQFETPKEKECWKLYRKMCEKGLSVSFDTVLRGMLTPTEYRLRRGALLSTC